MRKIVFIVFAFFFLGFVPHQSMMIRPGESVGPFALKKTTYKEIKEELEGGRMKEHFFMLSCGMKRSYDVLFYKREGMTFTFEEKEIKKTGKIYSIQINEKCDAVTSEGLRAGHSTRGDIRKAYGTPSAEDDAGYNGRMDYSQLGIEFEFQHGWNVKKETDTVRIIYVYPKD